MQGEVWSAPDGGPGYPCGEGFIQHCICCSYMNHDVWWTARFDQGGGSDYSRAMTSGRYMSLTGTGLGGAGTWGEWEPSAGGAWAMAAGRRVGGTCQ